MQRGVESRGNRRTAASYRQTAVVRVQGPTLTLFGSNQVAFARLQLRSPVTRLNALFHETGFTASMRKNRPSASVGWIYTARFISVYGKSANIRV